MLELEDSLKAGQPDDDLVMFLEGLLDDVTGYFEEHARLDTAELLLNDDGEMDLSERQRSRGGFHIE